MTENKRYSFNWERGHPQFWDNHCDLADCYLTCEDVVELLNGLHDENTELKNENRKLKQFKENVIKWVDSQMKFNVKKYIETEDYHFKSENVDLHNFKVFIGIDSND